MKIAILFGAVIALLAATVYQFVQIDRVRGEISKLRTQLADEISGLRETSSVSTQSQRKHIDELRDQLETARRQAAMAAGQAKVEAQRHAEQLARRLEEEQKKQQEQLQQQMTTEITEVKQAASATTAKLGEVSTEVGAVKSEVASTKSELEKTISELKRVTGDLGVTSGLVATNSKEIAALRALGERNIYEFRLGKTKQPQKVGDISLKLRNADTKRNRYSLELIVDDKKVEKRDKNINEPVQFYAAKGGRIPYEIVVNEVKKDLIVGYLATPKVIAQR